MVQGHNYCFEHQQKAFVNTGTMDNNASIEQPPPIVKEMCKISYDIALKTVNLLNLMWQVDLLGKNPPPVNPSRRNSHNL